MDISAFELAVFSLGCMALGLGFGFYFAFRSRLLMRQTLESYARDRLDKLEEDCRDLTERTQDEVDAQVRRAQQDILSALEDQVSQQAGFMISPDPKSFN